MIGSRRIAALVAALFAAAPVIANGQDAPSIREGGCIQVIDKEGKPQGQCPLEHTDVHVDIAGFIARVTLTQRFGNPFPDPIEAIYTFPMSDRAAVDTMLMKIGNRLIRGVVKEREEAQRIYQQARDAGQAASLLDQERPNIFTQSVANILPGDTIEITISYVEYLKYDNGEYEFSFPMVVGPRYIPGNPLPPDSPQPDVVPGLRPGPAKTDQVPDSGRITPPITPEGTRAGHDIALEVHVDAGLPLQSIKSELHDVDVDTPTPKEAVIRLKDKAEIPNRDFVLKYAVAGGRIEDAVLTHAGAQGGFFTLILQPPDRVAPEAITPKEMIFVIDVSGSMSGFPIEKAKKSMKMCIEGMNPDDTFNLVTFAGGLGYCFDKPMPNTDANRKKALDYLSNLEGGGGTEMMAAINAALGNQNDPERLRVICFMTDGYIGNDMAILDAIQKHAGTARVFSFGIGNSVNRFLIEGMAKAGRGAAEIITLESDGDDAAERFHERIQNPVLTDITVDFGDLDVYDVYPDPGALPDLFSARPVIITGRYKTSGDGTVTLRGQTAGGDFERSIDIALPASEPDHDVLAPLWARQKIEDLMEQDWLGAQMGTPDRDVKSAVTEIGLEFSLVTQYTSFVAVEEKVITKGGKPTTVQVPVEMPEGVSYEGIFGESEEVDMVRRTAGLQIQQLQSLGYAGSSANTPARPKLSEQAPATVAPEPLAMPDAPVDRPSSESRDEKADKDHAPVNPKLDQALRGLAGKVVHGSYSDGAVKVVDGKVEVFVYLTRLDDAALAALKNAGGKVLAEVRSSKLVRLSIQVERLEELAKLDVVKAITPPQF